MPLPTEWSLWALFLAALGASFHCTGMCGGFVLAGCGGGFQGGVGPRPASWSSALRSQALYHVGKGTTYVFLGMLAGRLGEALFRGGSLAVKGLSIVGAIFFLIAGCSALGFRFPPLGPTLLRSWSRAFTFFGWRPLASGLISLRSPLAPLYLGTLSGLLPCPIVYAFAANAASHGSLAAGAAVMGILELGTLPSLLVLAGLGKSAPAALRAQFVRASGLLLVLLGIWTCYRGWVETPCCTPGGF